MSNADLWKTVTEHLTSGATVRNWTAAKGYFGEDFVVKSIEPDHLVVAAPGAENEQHVPRKDFELVDKVWGGYCSGAVKRQQLRDMTRFSKYVVSILHQVSK
jgi:hypothetical protein